LGVILSIVSLLLIVVLVPLELALRRTDWLARRMPNT
jgi:hypothetical protein